MKIVLGTANFNSFYGVNKKKVKKEELKKIINYCYKKKIDYLDTAYSYKNFKLLKKYNLKKFKIITKLPDLKKIKKKNLRNEIINHTQDMLRNLNIKQIYGLLLHNVQPMYNSKSKVIINTLEYLKKKKLVKKIGISCYHIKDLDLTKKNNLDIIQFPLNIFDQRLIKSKIFTSLKRKNIEIHVRSIFLQGLLLKKIKKIDIYFYKWKKEFLKLDYISKEYKKTKLELCINFIKQQKLVDKVIIGVENKKQIDLIAKLFERKFFKFGYDSLIQQEKKLIIPYLWKLNEKN